MLRVARSAVALSVLACSVLACSVLASSVVACSSPPSEPPAPATSTSDTAPSPTTESTTTTSAEPTSTTATDPAGRLPGDLTPNVVEDECLLTAVELGTLVGRGALRAENTELAGGSARRSCFYAPDVAEDPVARIDVYASSSLPPPELVARIAANGGKALTGVGQGAVVVTGQDGAFELAVASATLLAVLTVLPGAAPLPPADDAWTTAGTAIASRLP